MQGKDWATRSICPHRTLSVILSNLALSPSHLTTHTQYADDGKNWLVAIRLTAEFGAAAVPKSYKVGCVCVRVCVCVHVYGYANIFMKNSVGYKMPSS